MDIIIFSKDRAFQLYTSLETIQKHVSNINNIYVQFAYSNEKYLAGYEKLNKIFNDVTFIDETLHGFQNTMYALLDSEVQSENVMLEVDDTIYYKDLDLKKCSSILDKNIDAGKYGFGFDYTIFNKSYFIDHDTHLSINRTNTYDRELIGLVLNYPFNASSAIHRKKDLLFSVKSELNINNEEVILSQSDLTDVSVENLPTLDEQLKKVEKIKKQRESLGSVNLRADEETKKYEQEIKKMEDDRADLYSAIVKLKTSIDELNQKGRERLLDAYTKVNRKFSEVYTKLFNGGTAKIELVDSDDPLEAGLEMYVSPPGKRLQSITLLSGGEQALTALSLVFAVFLVNPSPICVLDEVDAPLDDANVTRFCGLLDELVKITKTKFILITHHALTMSRMHRLYGVTMAEQGVSQLVSVDLQKAEELVA